MAEAATCEELQEGFEKHLEETEIHVTRLETIFKLLGKDAKGKKCQAMEGLIAEGKEAIETKVSDGQLRDELLVNAARKVEHYEMAAYCTLGTWAEELGMSEALNLLKQTYEEEKATDEKLREHAISDAEHLENSIDDIMAAKKKPARIG